MLPIAVWRLSWLPSCSASKPPALPTLTLYLQQYPLQFLQITRTWTWTLCCFLCTLGSLAVLFLVLSPINSLYYVFFHCEATWSQPGTSWLHLAPASVSAYLPLSPEDWISVGQELWHFLKIWVSPELITGPDILEILNKRVKDGFY